ncbi:type II toxin-antitoxin system HicB family antitoxin [uncultured Dokdonia sp.]|uniref:type II toxin-antitoxin system HicB family antitoxin n=1 Tax=uncultured Dokdonia sp. TaxID=575653 RepID=UPI00263412F6|nr:type II toxin-antitoxin system HicB family antitoxin [uncultured Dokdonia sp.]
MEKKSLTAVIEKTGTGFSGYIKEISGIVSVADSLTEIKENLSDALELKLESIEDIKLEYVIDLEQFFEYYNVLNKSAFADYIGMNRSLFRQYISGLTNLSDKKLLDISKGLHRLAEDFSDVVLVK